MKTAIAIFLILGLALPAFGMTDSQARTEAVKRWHESARIRKTCTPVKTSCSWLYEVGFTTPGFGMAVMGSGSSWQKAFENIGKPAELKVRVP